MSTKSTQKEKQIGHCSQVRHFRQAFRHFGYNSFIDQFISSLFFTGFIMFLLWQMSGWSGKLKQKLRNGIKTRAICRFMRPRSLVRVR